MFLRSNFDYTYSLGINDATWESNAASKPHQSNIIWFDTLIKTLFKIIMMLWSNVNQSKKKLQNYFFWKCFTRNNSVQSVCVGSAQHVTFFLFSPISCRISPHTFSTHVIFYTVHPSLFSPASTLISIHKFKHKTHQQDTSLDALFVWRN